MIDEYWTFRLYGYHSDNLVPGSGKRVIAPCEECHCFRSIQMRRYNELCNKCVKHDPTTRRKMSDSAKTRPPITAITRHKKAVNSRGRECSASTRHKLAEANGGKNHWNWKGGITPWRDGLRKTPAYKNWRTAVFERDDYTCQACDTRGGKLEAHHIRPVRDHKNDLLIYDVNNGITLCNRCHSATKNREYDYIEEFEARV